MAPENRPSQHEWIFGAKCEFLGGNLPKAWIRWLMWRYIVSYGCCEPPTNWKSGCCDPKMVAPQTMDHWNDECKKTWSPKICRMGTVVLGHKLPGIQTSLWFWRYINSKGSKVEYCWWLLRFLTKKWCKNQGRTEVHHRKWLGKERVRFF